VRELNADRQRSPKNGAALAAKTHARKAPARVHEPDPGPGVFTGTLIVSRPAVTPLASGYGGVSISAGIRIFLFVTAALALFFWALAAAPGRLLVTVSAGLAERRADLAFGGLCVLTTGLLTALVVAVAG
jgi:hypothetical protein